MKHRLSHLSFLCWMLFSGCNFHQKQKIKVDENYRYKEILAKYSDIPDVPFQAVFINMAYKNENPDQVQFFYKSSLPREQLIIFYEQQMELLGWRLITRSDLTDLLLVYEKPEIVCSILMQKSMITIYFSSKAL